MIGDYDREASAAATSTATPEQVLRLATDLTGFSTWFEMHDSWRGDVPARASLGLEVVESVRLMGIPAEIAWTVVQLDDRTFALSGEGPMGLLVGVSVSAATTVHGGSEIEVEIGLGGDPVQGPMGATIEAHVEGAAQQTADALAAKAADHVGPAEPEPGSGPVVHARTGVRLHPNTPVLVGVGQLVQRDPVPDGPDPAALSAEALRRAEADAGVTGLLAEADAVYAIASVSWQYGDQAAAVAAAVGAEPEVTVVSSRFGGDAGQLLVNEAGRAIAAGEASVVLVSGAEAGATQATAQKAGQRTEWPVQPAGTAPTRVLGKDAEANNDAEAKAGLGAPVYMYGLIESAIRAKSGAGIAEHRDRITGLWSDLSHVAAANPYAWSPTAHSAERLATADEANRMVTTPYPKLLCANLQVDLASGLILCSAAAAEAAGVPQEKWVFLHAGAAAHDEWFVSERGDLAASPAIRTIGRAVLEHAGLTVDDVAHVDLYSCFPSAVQIAAAELGLPVGDPDRPLSVTGGLTFGGGPGNNYGTHAVASLVQRLREDPDSYGLSTSLGWYLTKHAIGIYSATPPRTSYRSLTPVVDATPTRRALGSFVGDAVIDAYTVQFDRSGAPEAIILSAVTPDGDRALRRYVGSDLAARGVEEELVGLPVRLEEESATLLGDSAVAVPEPPALPVLVERRGEVTLITLNRPQVRNAIDLRTALLLERAIDGFEADPQARVAVLTGAGTAFSAGMDLKAAARGEFPVTERRGTLGICGVPPQKPMIAAVEGSALAGGCELALAADLIVAAENAQFGLPEPKRGLVAAAGGVLRLAQRLPRNLAMEMALTAEPQPVSRMAELGLVNRVVPAGQAVEAAIELAETIAANAPMSVAISKQIVLESPDWSTAEEFQRQSELATPAIFSEDAVEGVVAFNEKRAPVWKGR
ncbi:crotonase/enoyl-CoA hydratase family protein [Nocardioides stalactiti]|uniref:crotonase/enoyl-CoA hydratase family protein n=1 Tax=Nocardioides stalactiti TaxID=2755356 RepID=UPI0028AC1BD6|nr:crotonase/enoyl-CoA hydratase family protein [Nocardioides stalactiti]